MTAQEILFLVPESWKVATSGNWEAVVLTPSQAAYAITPVEPSHPPPARAPVKWKIVYGTDLETKDNSPPGEMPQGARLRLPLKRARVPTAAWWRPCKAGRLWRKRSFQPGGAGWTVKQVSWPWFSWTRRLGRALEGGPGWAGQGGWMQSTSGLGKLSLSWGRPVPWGTESAWTRSALVTEVSLTSGAWGGQNQSWERQRLTGGLLKQHSERSPLRSLSYPLQTLHLCIPTSLAHHACPASGLGHRLFLPPGSSHPLNTSLFFKPQLLSLPQLSLLHGAPSLWISPSRAFFILFLLLRFAYLFNLGCTCIYFLACFLRGGEHAPSLQLHEAWHILHKTIAGSRERTSPTPRGPACPFPVNNAPK